MPRVGYMPVGAASSSSNEERGAHCSFNIAALDAWLSGGMSAHLLQHLSHMVTLNPLHLDISELAALGSVGAHRGSISRDLTKWLDQHQSENLLPKPCKVACPLIDAKTKVQFNG